MELERLFPTRERTPVDDALSGLGLGEVVPGDRPYTVLNMVASLDGKTTVAGRVGSLTGPHDQRLLYSLRAEAEVLLVGAGTARAERYGNVLPDERLRARRTAAGLDPEPPVAIVTARLDIPPDLPLLNEPEAKVIVCTSSDGELPPAAARVSYVRRPPAPDGYADMRALLGALRTEHGVRSLLCEGGPTLNADLLAHGLVDEVFLSLSPKLVGGGERTLVAAAGAGDGELRDAELVSVLAADDYLFLRYRLAV